MTEERVRRTKMTLEGRDFVINYYRKADEFRVRNGEMSSSGKGTSLWRKARS